MADTELNLKSHMRGYRPVPEKRKKIWLPMKCLGSTFVVWGKIFHLLPQVVCRVYLCICVCDHSRLSLHTLSILPNGLHLNCFLVKLSRISWSVAWSFILVNIVNYWFLVWKINLLIKQLFWRQLHHYSRKVKKCDNSWRIQLGFAHLTICKQLWLTNLNYEMLNHNLIIIRTIKQLIGWLM